jgi:hypothetical protein
MLPHPRIVCGHKDCDAWTTCHDNCDINAPDGIKGVAKMVSCWAFRKYLVTRNNACCRCKHPSSEHMMLTYRMVVTERPLNDEEIHKCQAERSAKDDAKESPSQDQELASRLLVRLRAEEQQISEAQVLVGTYLGAFALTAYEDVLIKYLDGQITRAEYDHAVDKADELKEQRTQYKTRMTELQDSIARGQRIALTKQNVDDVIDGLKKMDIFGKFLSESLKAERVVLAERDIVAVPCRSGEKSKGLLKRLWSRV